MKNVTVRLSEDKVKELDDEADEQGVSRAEYIRSLIESRHESDEVEDELDRVRADYEETISELETTVERLENEKRLILEQKEENQELVEYVEQERTLTKRKASAGVVTRAKWWLVGMPEE